MLLGVDLAWNQDPDLQTEFTVYKQHSTDDNNKRATGRTNERGSQRANDPASCLW